LILCGVWNRKPPESTLRIKALRAGATTLIGYNSSLDSSIGGGDMAGTQDKKMGRRAILAGAAGGAAALMVNSTKARTSQPRKSLFQGPLPAADDYDHPNWTFARAKRLGFGMTVDEMAWCLGVYPSTVRRYERGAKVPRPAKVIYLMMGSGLVFTRTADGGRALHNVACELLSKGHGASLPVKMQEMLDPPFYGIRGKWQRD
jgi:hypothetical protein